MSELAEMGDQEVVLRELLQASGAGETAAFAELYARSAAALFGIALAVVEIPDLAELALLRAYEQIWRQAGSCDPAMASPSGWMATIVRRFARDIARRSGGNLDISATAARDAVTDRDDETSSGHQASALEVLRGLGHAEQRLVIAAYTRGESREHLAARLGLPPGAIKAGLRQAILNAQVSNERS